MTAPLTITLERLGNILFENYAIATDQHHYAVSIGEGGSITDRLALHEMHRIRAAYLALHDAAHPGATAERTLNDADEAAARRWAEV